MFDGGSKNREKLLRKPTSWNPSFNLDAVPDIPQAKLPEHPLPEDKPRSFTQIVMSSSTTRDKLSELISSQSSRN